MSSFFEPPPPPPELPPQPPRRPWHGGPDSVIGRAVTLNLVIDRSEKAGIWIPTATVYGDGFEFDVEIRHRLNEAEFDHPFMLLHHQHPRRRQPPEEGLDPTFVRFGIEFADGRKATNLGGRMPFPLPGEPDAPPEGPILSPSRGGGGGGGRWHHGFWAWPLPPEGPLMFVCEWPAGEIAETRTAIDSALIRDAASEAIELWPEEAVGPAAVSGSTFSMLRAMRAPAPEGAHPEAWRELAVESKRKTHLIDITDQTRELVAGTPRRRAARARVPLPARPVRAGDGGHARPPPRHRQVTHRPRARTAEEQLCSLNES